MLIWLSTKGRIEPAGATAAAGAVVLLGQRLRGLAGSAGSLYEGSLFLEDFISLSSVRSADRIYVLADGEVVEEGTHMELMERRGPYAEMFTMQASAYGYSEV